MTPLDLPRGMAWRPAVRDDLPAVHRLIAAYEERVLGEVLSDVEDLEADWQRPSFDAAHDAVVVVEVDDLVACMEVYRGRRATGCVRPDRWGQGIGSALLDWAVRRSAQLGASLIGQTVPDADPAAVELFRRRGWSPRWTSWVLELPPGGAVAARPLPEGYRLRALQGVRCGARPGRAARRAVDRLAHGGADALPEAGHAGEVGLHAVGGRAGPERLAWHPCWW